MGVDWQYTMNGKRSGRCQSKSYLLAPAKLNLGLSITGRRGDGYHLLESLFWPIDLCDELEVQPAAENKIDAFWLESYHQGDPKLPPQKENLVARARALMDIKGAVKILLKKRIPIGSGLGGGSSDAAAILRCESHDTVDGQKCLSAAKLLGADVAFFLDPKPAWVTGVGEACRYLNVDPVLIKSLWFLLVFPPYGIATREIFDHYRNKGGSYSQSKTPFVSSTVTTDSLETYFYGAKNDLEPVVCEYFPNIKRILEHLRSTPCLYAGLSGTGSTCFAVYSKEAKNWIKDSIRFFRLEGCKSAKVKTFVEAQFEDKIAAHRLNSKKGEHHGNHRGESISS